MLTTRNIRCEIGYFQSINCQFFLAHFRSIIVSISFFELLLLLLPHHIRFYQYQKVFASPPSSRYALASIEISHGFNSMKIVTLMN
jgi:hypothetical protein